jgi:hypothetical protein
MESSVSSFMTGFINRVIREFDIDPKNKYPELKDLMVLAKVDDPILLSECLADTFASFTMGPAYAYSSMLLTFDPLVVSDQYRAQPVFRALERLNERDEYQVFNDLLRNLTNLWEQAIQEVKVKSQSSPRSLEVWSNLLLNYLKDIANLPFPVADWPGIQESVIEMLTGPKMIDTKTLSIRLVLAAAWQARIDFPANNLISERCYQLCNEISLNCSSTVSQTNPNFINMAR